MKEICRKLIKIIITIADKVRTVVITDKHAYQQKVKTFVKENRFTKMCNDPTDVYQKINTTAVHYIPLTWDISYASAGQDHIGCHIVKDICMHNPENINNWKL